MRKYVSLGSALMMGVVLGKENKTPAFAVAKGNAPLPLGLTSMLQPAQALNKVAHEAKERKARVVDSPDTSIATSIEKSPDVRSVNTSEGTSAATSEKSPNVKMVVEIYCGVAVNCVPNYNFYCYDWIENRL